MFKQAFDEAAFERFTGHVDRAYVFAEPVGFQQGFKRRRHGVDQRDVVSQFQHISHDIDTAAGRQWREAFIDRQVEVERGREQRLGQRGVIERTMRPGQEVHGITVFDHHALRQAGRTRGVDHIRQMRRGQLFNHRIGDGFVLPNAATQIDNQHRSVAQKPKRRGLRQYHSRRAVLQHVGNPIQRVSRIQRHITAARLQNRQQPNDHLPRALNTNRHPRIRSHTLPAQIMCQAVRPLIQLAITQPLLAINHRHRIRRAFHLSLKQPMNRLVQRIHSLSRIEPDQHLLTLRRRQYRQPIQRSLWRLLQRQHQPFQRRLHIRANPLRPDLRGHQHRQLEAVTQIIHVQRQRIVGAFLTTQHLHPTPRVHGLSRYRARRTVAIVEQRAEQRRRCGHATATLGQCQRGMLMTEQRSQPRMGRLDPGFHALAADIHAQRQGIDEHPQRPVGAITALHPAHQHGAEHHVQLARHLAQHLGKRQMHQACCAHAELACLCPQSQVQRRVDKPRMFFDIPAISLHIL
ncbi:hypothetical protein FX983_06541 [Pseudomonas frederiksbergensis]|uniref:Uncharacterized protein n=1 Tax=Pseudomonas frederiksbergensis TaxID=104087 RepID=A0A6L5BJY3_9PSED|nr:hypothetical protein FX983_06541 [Pseudomonas frederiksbergensis]